MIYFTLIRLLYRLNFCQEVDTELKNICEEFISTAVDSFVSPLTSFLDKIDTLAKLAEEEGKEKRQLIGQQPFAKPGGLCTKNGVFENILLLHLESLVLLF